MIVRATTDSEETKRRGIAITRTRGRAVKANSIVVTSRKENPEKWKHIMGKEGKRRGATEQER